MKLGEIAKMLHAEIKGNPEIEVRGVKDIEFIATNSADGKPLSDYIYYVESKKNYNKHPEIKGCGVVLTSTELAPKFQNAIFIPETDLRLRFISLLELFEKKYASNAGIAKTAYIADSAEIDKSAAVLPGAVILEGARIGENSVIHPNAVIEQNVVIGNNTIIHPNVVVKHDCKIGDHCILHSGVIIGADGFGFYDKDGVRYKIPQIGNVIIGNHVEIGASSTIDRAAIESTIIGDYTKMDDQVHVGHNCRIGEYVYIAGNAGVAGSVVVHARAIIAGQSAVSDHVTVGEKSIIMGLTGVAQDTEPGGVYFGVPARPIREMHKINSALQYLPELLKRVKNLEDKLN